MSTKRFSYTTKCKWCGKAHNREYPGKANPLVNHTYDKFLESMKMIATPTMIVQFPCDQCGGLTIQELVSYQPKAHEEPPTQQS